MHGSALKTPIVSDARQVALEFPKTHTGGMVNPATLTQVARIPVGQVPKRNGAAMLRR